MNVKNWFKNEKDKVLVKKTFLFVIIWNLLSTPTLTSYILKVTLNLLSGKKWLIAQIKNNKIKSTFEKSVPSALNKRNVNKVKGTESFDFGNK